MLNVLQAEDLMLTVMTVTPHSEERCDAAIVSVFQRKNVQN